MKIKVIDLFCGAGGVSTGFIMANESSNNKVEIIACINHDEMAIQSHSENHPNAIHYTEDIRTFDVSKLKALVENERLKEPCIIVLWASLECTNFSNAKGGLSRDADSRTLACDLLRYIDSINPDHIWIENVKEFMAWGPLVPKIESIKYDNYIAHSTVLRWDKKTKSFSPCMIPESRTKGIDYQKWVKDVQKRGYLFDFKILNAADYGSHTHRVRYFAQFCKPNFNIKWPAATHSKEAINDAFGSRKTWNPVKEVLDFTNEGLSIFKRKNQLSEATLKRILRGLNKFVKNGESDFLIKYYSTGDNTQSINKVAPTLTTKDRLAKINAVFIARDFTNGGNISSINSPAGTIMAVPKLNLVSAIKKQYYLVNPQFSSDGGSVDKPCFTLIARMDKKPPYLVCTEIGNSNVTISNNDSEVITEIKKFMIENGVLDIKYRQLTISELKKIQGFPDDYILKGTKSEQKKFIGNSVPPRIVQHLVSNAYL